MTGHPPITVFKQMQKKSEVFNDKLYSGQYSIMSKPWLVVSRMFGSIFK